MAVQSRLNPRAAEFFPAKLLVYHVSPSPHHHFNLFFPSPINPGHSSIYYSPVLHYSNIHRSNGFLLQNHDDHIHRRSVNPPPVNEPSPNDSVQTSSSNLMTPTQVLHEPKPEIEVVSRGGNTNPKPPSSNCKRGGARKGGYYGNERAKGYNSNGNSSSRRLHARSSLGFRCRPKSYPVVPIQSDGHCTTVMIKNIPNKYTRVLLMEFLDNHCMLENEKANKLQNNDRILSAFDFLYLPMDFEYVSLIYLINTH
ncbi:protein MEI2-like 6 [Mercurialis annua]|uniref:protein MEI2-like 6 n=1 Tax=Mercurialis annua TaxID=3986 RepID=UPI0024AD0A8A|nr:protein MEI2-like 6 [Mercurialis annua]